MVSYEHPTARRHLIEAACEMLPKHAVWDEDGMLSWITMIEAILRASYGIPSRSQSRVQPRLLGDVSLGLLRMADGEPMHAGMIYEDAYALGASTGSATPIHVIDALLRGLQKRGEPIERVATHVWRWVGDTPASSDQEPGVNR